MFCPKCSQLQSSDEMRFCSRCGFPLVGVAMLVEKDGVIPQLLETPGQTVPSARKKLMTESAIFTAIPWAVALAATLLFDVGGRFENVAKIAALLFALLGLVGLLRFLYGFLFVKDLVDQPERNAFRNIASQGAMGEAPRRAALPAQRALPATDYSRRANTKEMAPQPSVTENTTRLLEEPPFDRGD